MKQKTKRTLEIVGIIAFLIVFFLPEIYGAFHIISAKMDTQVKYEDNYVYIYSKKSNEYLLDFTDDYRRDLLEISLNEGEERKYNMQSYRKVYIYKNMDRHKFYYVTFEFSSMIKFTIIFFSSMGFLAFSCKDGW